MGLTLALLATLLSLSGCHQQSHYGYSSSYGSSYGRERDTRTDSYGTFHYDQFGYRTYTRCREAHLRAQDQCRDRGRGRDYGNTYNSYDRYDDRYNGRGKVNVGSGTFRLRGRDAVLTCDFPRGSNIVSNLVWERVADRSYGSRRSQNGYRRSGSLRDSLGRRMRVRSIGDFGSELVIEDYTERDAGIYRCVGTRSYDSYGSSSYGSTYGSRASYGSSYGSYRPSYGSTYGSRPSYGYSRGGYGRTETVYMEVQFAPRDGDYSGAFGGDYYPDNSYRDDYGYRVAAVTSSEDKIVADNKLGGEEKSKEAV